jgi:hypothetical protein
MVQNIKIRICAIFGHKLNDNPYHHWCGRCKLSYDGIYRRYFNKMADKLVKESEMAVKKLMEEV